MLLLHPSIGVISISRRRVVSCPNQDSPSPPTFPQLHSKSTIECTGADLDRSEDNKTTRSNRHTTSEPETQPRTVGITFLVHFIAEPLDAHCIDVHATLPYPLITFPLPSYHLLIPVSIRTFSASPISPFTAAQASSHGHLKLNRPIHRPTQRLPDATIIHVLIAHLSWFRMPLAVLVLSAGALPP